MLDIHAKQTCRRKSKRYITSACPCLKRMSDLSKPFETFFWFIITLCDDRKDKQRN